MANTNIIAPVGAQNLTEILDGLSDNSVVFTYSSIAPPHYIVPLDAGNGQSTFANYITDVMEENNLRTFNSIERCVEYSLNGTLMQLKDVFADIRACAVYTNDFDGVVAIDISALAAYINEPQVEIFMSEISRLSKNATFIFFIGSTASRGINLLKNKLINEIGNIRYVDVQPYSEKELADIACRRLEEFGFSFKGDFDYAALLEAIVAKKGCKTVKELDKVIEDIVKHADYSGFMPVITGETLSAVLNNKGGTVNA